MKIALIGYGKMGKELEKAALSRGHEIVCIIDVDNQEDFESEAFKSADVAIEFTNPMVAYSNYMKAFKAGVKLVSGSTGWMAEHGEEIKSYVPKEENPFLVVQLQSWSSHLLVCQQVSGKNNESIPRL